MSADTPSTLQSDDDRGNSEDADQGCTDEELPRTSMMTCAVYHQDETDDPDGYKRKTGVSQSAQWISRVWCHYTRRFVLGCLSTTR